MPFRTWLTMAITFSRNRNRSETPPAFQNRLTCNVILLHLRRQTASLAPYGSVEVKPVQSQCPGLSDFIKLRVCNFFLIFPHSSHIFYFTSSSCTVVPPSVLSKCVLEKCLLACCKTCFDKYQLQVNDTVNEHCIFSLPFSLKEGDNAWKGGKIETEDFFSLHVPHVIPFSSHKGLIQALCTHHTLL